MDGFGAAAAAAMFVAIVLSASPLAAEPAGRLAYRRGAGAEGCPDETALRRAVASRLGEDPFDAAAPSTFDVTVARDGDAFHGRVALVSASGTESGVREMRGASDCVELVDALALGISLAINPALATGTTEPAAAAPAAPPPPPNPAPEPKAALEPTSAAADDPPEASTRREKPDWRFAGGVLGLASLGTAPQAAFGVGALLRARYRSFSLAVEGRYDFPSSKLLDNGADLETRLVMGVLAPCYHFEQTPVAACALGAVGSVTAEAPNLPGSHADTGTYAALGARGALEFAELPWVRFQARLDLLATLMPVRAYRNQGTETVWEMPRISGTLGVGALIELP